MPQVITERDVLDLAARIAVQARIDDVEMEKSQVENLLTSVETSSDPKNSPWVVALYAYRQARRGKIGRRTADLIYEAMSKLGEAGRGREDVRRLLGFMKWVYESLEGARVPRRIDNIRSLTLQDVLKMLRELR